MSVDPNVPMVRLRPLAFFGPNCPISYHAPKESSGGFANHLDGKGPKWFLGEETEASQICSRKFAEVHFLVPRNEDQHFMLIVMQSHATETQIRAVCERIESLGLKAHPIPGSLRTAIGITGNKGSVDLGVLESMAGVVECIPVSKPYKLVSRDAKEEDTVLRI